jgi:hypothetical protein
VVEPRRDVVRQACWVAAEPGWARCWCWSCRDRPSAAGVAHPEHGHPGEVDRAGEEPEVGVDPFGAFDPGSSAAVERSRRLGI